MSCLLEISFQLLPGKRQEFLQSVTMFTDRQDKDRTNSLVYEDRSDPDHLLWVEEWTEKPKLDRHLETDVFKTLMGAIRTLATVEDVRIVELGLTQHSYRFPGYKPRHLEGRRICDSPEDQAQAEGTRSQQNKRS